MGGSGGLKTFCGTELVLTSSMLRESLHKGQRSDLQRTEGETADSGWAPRKVQSGTEPLDRGMAAERRTVRRKKLRVSGPR